MKSNPYESVATEKVDVASEAEVQERLDFIRQTYLLLAAAIGAFIGLEFAIFQTGLAMPMTELIFSWGQLSWILTFGLFIGVGGIADRLARSEAAEWIQYAGLGLFVVAETVICVPLLTVAAVQSGITTIAAAGVVTASVFSVLTGYVFVTKQDFSFLGPFLSVATVVAFGAIAFSWIFGFSLGTFFAMAVVLLASGYIVYRTSAVLHHYRTDQPAAAALALFSAVALLFYYILMLFLGGE